MFEYNFYLFYYGIVLIHHIIKCKYGETTIMLRMKDMHYYYVCYEPVNHTRLAIRNKDIWQS